MKVADHIESLIAYKPGKPVEEVKREFGLEQIHKLASNECPLAPSESVVSAITAAASGVNEYPDPSGYYLAQMISKKWGLPSDWIGFGNGSNEIIDLLIRTFCQRGENVLTSAGAFIAYKICAEAAGVEFQQVPLSEQMGFDLEKIDQALNDKTRLLFIANPNNPTGTYVGKEALHHYLEKWGKRENLLVVMDEAYNEFVRAEDFPHGLDFINKYPNVMVLRTLSKVYALAGLRIGVLLGRPEHLQYYHRVRNPFNVNSLAQAAAQAVLEDESFLKASQKVCWEGLDYFYQELAQEEFPYVPSQANFVLFDCGHDSREVFQKLLKRGLILRPVVEYGLPTHLRMSVGLPESNRFAMECLRKELRS